MSEVSALSSNIIEKQRDLRDSNNLDGSEHD
jgi:hypothetical protein